MKRVLLALAAVALAAAPAAAQQWGNLEITFTLDGKAPTPKKLDVSKEAYCVPQGLVDESLVVSADNKIKNVVVGLVVDRGGKAPAVHPDVKKAASEPVRLDNIKCRFEPRVCFVTANQPLIIGNKDPVGHNSKIDLLSNNSINPLIPANGEVKQSFPMAERLPMPVSCNIHPWMGAYLWIREDPYAAASDEKGVCKIDNLPAGEWTFLCYHGKNVSKVKVNGAAADWTRGRFKAKIEAGKTTKLDVKIAPENLVSN